MAETDRMNIDERRKYLHKIWGRLVHHCGPTVGGIFIYSLQMVDVATGWAEPIDIYGNYFQATKDGFDFLLALLPFDVLELHPDRQSDHQVAFFTLLDTRRKN